MPSIKLTTFWILMPTPPNFIWWIYHLQMLIFPEFGFHTRLLSFPWYDDTKVALCHLQGDCQNNLSMLAPWSHTSVLLLELYFCCTYFAQLLAVAIAAEANEDGNKQNSKIPSWPLLVLIALCLGSAAWFQRLSTGLLLKILFYLTNRYIICHSWAWLMS